MLIEVIGVDPALSNLGLARAVIDTKNNTFQVTDLELVTTKATKTKFKGAKKNADDIDRCRVLYQGLKKAEVDAKIAFVEIPIGSQSARAMTSYGACVALIASLDIPVVQLTPTELKMCACNDANASKESMIGWAVERFPQANWLRLGRKKEGRILASNEHLADAVGAINAGLNSPEYKALIKMLFDEKEISGNYA